VGEHHQRGSAGQARADLASWRAACADYGHSRAKELLPDKPGLRPFVAVSPLLEAQRLAESYASDQTRWRCSSTRR
jgi:hypothetical protein